MDMVLSLQEGGGIVSLDIRLLISIGASMFCEELVTGVVICIFKTCRGTSWAPSTLNLRRNIISWFVRKSCTYTSGLAAGILDSLGVHRCPFAQGLINKSGGYQFWETFHVNGRKSWRIAFWTSLLLKKGSPGVEEVFSWLRVEEVGNLVFRWSHVWVNLENVVYWLLWNFLLRFAFTDLASYWIWDFHSRYVLAGIEMHTY